MKNDLVFGKEKLKNGSFKFWIDIAEPEAKLEHKTLKLRTND